MASSSTPDLFDDPHVQAIFKDVIGVVVAESDRGAVLVATSVVDEHLRRFFEHRLPKDMQSKAQKKRLLDYPGPLGSLAAKAEIARAVGLLGKNAYDAIQRLRRLRNHVAHSPASFRLSDHRNTLWEMYELGKGTPQLINRMAAEFVIQDVVKRLIDFKIEIPGEEPKLAFEDAEDILRRLHETPDAMDSLQEKALRLELGIAVGLLCGLIAVYRELPRVPEKPERPTGDDQEPQETTDA